MRTDGRKNDELRQVKVTKNFVSTAEGSALIEMGRTRVLCTATIEDRVPQFLKDSGKGWVTGEYSLLPRSTSVRTPRESAKGKVSGRTHEIQRLIGRSLRSVVDMKVLGERTITIDCDVIEADGGTRTASITGGFICMADAIRNAMDRGMIARSPLLEFVAAVSVGVVDGAVMLDLKYDEDYGAEVDMNVVMTGRGEFVEVQGTAEGRPFSAGVMNEMVELAAKGVAGLVDIQRAYLPQGMLK